MSIYSKLAGKSIVALLIKIAAAGLSFVMFVALARAMSQDDFGTFGFAFSLATILAVLGSFGQRNLVIRFASVYLDNDDEAKAYAVIRHSYQLVFIGAAVLGAALIAASFLPVLVDLQAVLIATSSLVVTLALAEFQPFPQRAAGVVWRALLPRDVLLRLLMIGLAFLAIRGFVPQLSAVTALWYMSSSLLVLIVFQAISLKITHPRHWLLAPRLANKETQEWRRATWGMWGNSVVSSSGRNVAIVILGSILPAVTTGAVFAALRTAMVLELFLVAINVVAAPLLASRLARGATAEVQRICILIAAMIGLPTLVCFGIFVFWGDKVLELFGSGFGSAHAELVVISFGYLVSAFSGPTTQLMEMAGYERQYFLILALTTGISLAALPFAVMWFGSIGAAVCISFNLISLNVVSCAFIHRSIGVSSGIIPLGNSRLKAAK